ncbi:hypothetical protein CPB84DRAFT_1680697 [Gymnopilus junonius]|uniref:Ribonucleases P/MRP subunit Pop8-like domain-containing protein n=1 Tax=Gymnopilus junonius TaxID=109634 RepID=A0A9P5NME1_GYMJU|nr:hypothetical protein CPB84DRAFT_1680697 [Gymnopilus junonius]
MRSEPLTLNNHYMRFSMMPPATSDLTVRKAIADSLTESFGLTASSTYLDILWVSDNGCECVIRSHKDDVAKIAGALASRTESPRLTLQKESPFLLSLMNAGPGL